MFFTFIDQASMDCLHCARTARHIETGSRSRAFCGVPCQASYYVARVDRIGDDVFKVVKRSSAYPSNMLLTSLDRLRSNKSMVEFAWAISDELQLMHNDASYDADAKQLVYEFIFSDRMRPLIEADYTMNNVWEAIFRRALLAGHVDVVRMTLNMAHVSPTTAAAVLVSYADDEAHGRILSYLLALPGFVPTSWLLEQAKASGKKGMTRILLADRRFGYRNDDDNTEPEARRF